MHVGRKQTTPQLKAKDFYQTHPSMVRALIDKKLCNAQKYQTILDPCCGNKIIGTHLRLAGFHDITEIDLYPANKLVSQADFMEFRPLIKNFDIFIMNPPFSNKYRFIDRALGIAKTSVYVLLPLDVSNYNYFHQNYLNKPHYKGRLLMTPKMILHENTETKFGGAVSYAWYEFGTRNIYSAKYETYADLREYM